MLKKRVLDRAVNEINDKTDIQINYHLVREGRKITDLKLVVENSARKIEHNKELETHVLDKLRVF